MTSVFRPAIERMAGYTPGEQPQEGGWIKLNTNENPYPPSPRVVDAVRRAAEGRLNVYPDPRATAFRKVAAELLHVDPDWILPANGSDENLTMITRSFCDSGQIVGYPYPSYVLYEELAKIQGCAVVRLPLNAAFQWDAQRAADLRSQTRVFFAPNPNSPTGNCWTPAQLRELLPDEGVLVLDEAYGDFRREPHRGELLRRTEFDGRLIVTRSLSKSYSLAGIRFGFAVADPILIEGMQKVKDSYNCDTVSILAATAALEDQEWMLRNRDRILATRDRLSAELPQFGFYVSPSEANFVWTVHTSGRHREIYEQLKARRILVRYMRFEHARADGRVIDGLRITVGTDDEIDLLLRNMSEAVDAVSAATVSTAQDCGADQ